MRAVLKIDFYERATQNVARDLLGKFLVRRFPNGSLISRMITETEGYDGPHDLASHASRGRTARTDVMFGPAGIWYVYFVYGMHHMLNVVTGPEHYPAAVLIRSVEGICGPGRLTRALKITRTFNRMSASFSSGLWIENRGVRISASRVQVTPRIGVSYAKEWAHKPWRFVLAEFSANSRT